MHAHLMDDGEEDKKGKGIRKHVLKNRIVFEDIRDCVKQSEEYEKRCVVESDSFEDLGIFPHIIKHNDRHKEGSDQRSLQSSVSDSQSHRTILRMQEGIWRKSRSADNPERSGGKLSEKQRLHSGQD